MHSSKSIGDILCSSADDFKTLSFWELGKSKRIGGRRRDEKGTLHSERVRVMESKGVQYIPGWSLNNTFDLSRII